MKPRTDRPSSWRACATFAGRSPIHHYKIGHVVDPGAVGTIANRGHVGGVVAAVDYATGVLWLAPFVGYTANILTNEALGITPPGRLDWTDARGRLHCVRCVRTGNTWTYSDRAEPAHPRRR